MAWKWLIFVALLAPSMYYAFTYRAMPHTGHFHDDGVYLGSAQSLAEGRGFKVASIPGEPAQTRYPFLFPLYLSLAFRTAGGYPANPPAVMLLLWMLWPAALYLMWRWMARWKLAPWQQVAACAIVAYSAYTTLFAISALSDMLGGVIFLSAMWLAEEKDDWKAAASGLLAGCAYLTRSSLLALVVGIFLYLIWNRAYRRAAIFTAASAPAVLFWSWWTRANAFTGASELSQWYTNYMGWYRSNVSLEGFPSLLWQNLGALFHGIGGLFMFNPTDSVLELNLARILALGAISGVVRLARSNGLSVYHFFAAIFSCMLLIWNYVPHERLIFPLFTLLAAGLVTEVSAFLLVLRQSWTKQRGAAIVLGSVFGALLLTGAISNAGGLFQQVRYLLDRHQRETPARLEAFAWIRDNTPADARFLAYDDPGLYLRTRRHGFGLHFPTKLFYEGTRKDIEKWFCSAAAMARREGVTYILETPHDFEADLSAGEQAAYHKALDADGGYPVIHEAGGVRIRRAAEAVSASRF